MVCGCVPLGAADACAVEGTARVQRPDTQASKAAVRLLKDMQRTNRRIDSASQMQSIHARTAKQKAENGMGSRKPSAEKPAESSEAAIDARHVVEQPIPAPHIVQHEVVYPLGAVDARRHQHGGGRGVAHVHHLLLVHRLLRPFAQPTREASPCQMGLDCGVEKGIGASKRVRHAERFDKGQQALGGTAKRIKTATKPDSPQSHSQEGQHWRCHHHVVG